MMKRFRVFFTFILILCLTSSVSQIAIAEGKTEITYIVDKNLLTKAFLISYGGNGAGGSRDDSDYEETVFPTTPAIPVESSSASDNGNQTDADAQSETFSDSTLRISGARLHALIEANPEFVPFAWQNVNLLLSSDMLEGLNVADDSVFCVKIVKLGTNSFSISITLDGNKVTNIPDSKVQFSMEDPGDDVALWFGQEKLDTKVSYNEYYVAFPIDRTGTYKITSKTIDNSEAIHTDNPVNNASLYRHFSLLPIIIILFIILLTVILYFRRKGGTPDDQTKERP